MRRVRKLFSDGSLLRIAEQVERDPSLASVEHLAALAVRFPEEFGMRTISQVKGLIASERGARVLGYERRNRIRTSMWEADLAARRKSGAQGLGAAKKEIGPLDLSSFSSFARALAITRQPPPEERWRKRALAQGGEDVSLDKLRFA